jgi:hypothetical protein
MSSDLVKGMARVIVESMGDTPENAARAALLWLSKNVSDEMAEIVCYGEANEYWKSRIGKAIRAAAGGGE